MRLTGTEIIRPVAVTSSMGATGPRITPPAAVTVNTWVIGPTGSTRPISINRPNFETLIIGKNSKIVTGDHSVITGCNSSVQGTNTVLIGHNTDVTGDNNVIIANNKTFEGTNKLVIGGLSIDRSSMLSVYFRRKFKHKLPIPLIAIIFELCSDVDITVDLEEIIDELVIESIQRSLHLYIRS